MAAVHLARQREMQRLVALKELGGFQARDPASVERFLRESRLAGSLNHPNIVTVYEYFEDAGTPYIAMELVEGGSLRPLIGELSLPRVARVLEDVLAAVGHAGKAGIVHRDIKPENTLITKDGRVKVADFGIAKGAAASGQQGLTSEGMTVGTPEYMSPEQALGKDVTPQSDLYSIGCMTYEMLTGRLPFSGDTQGALLVKQVSEPVPDVREVDPLIPESVAQLGRDDDREGPRRPLRRTPPPRGTPSRRRCSSSSARCGAATRRSSPPRRSTSPTIPEQGAKPIAAQARRRSRSPRPAIRPTRRRPRCTSCSRATRTRRPPSSRRRRDRPPSPRRAASRRRRSPCRRPPAGRPPTDEAAAEDEPEPKPQRPLPVGLIARGGARRRDRGVRRRACRARSPTPPATANGDGFVLKAPAGWKPAAAG